MKDTLAVDPRGHIFFEFSIPRMGKRADAVLLHDRLKGEHGRLDPQLPKTPAHLSNALQRLQHGMAEIGLMIEMLPRTKMARPVRIWIDENELTPEFPEILRKINGDD